MMKTLSSMAVVLVALTAQSVSAQLLTFEYKIAEDKTEDYGIGHFIYDPGAFEDNVYKAQAAWLGQPMYSGQDDDPQGFIDNQVEQWNILMNYEPGVGPGGDNVFGWIFPAATSEDTLNFVNDENGQWLITTDPDGFAEKVPVVYENVKWLVPEPSTATLGLMGLLGMVGIARRRVRR